MGSFVLVEEADGHESTYTFDADRQCYVNVSEAGGSSTLTYQNGQWQGWNLSNNLKEYYNHNNQLEKLKDSFGNELSYEYDEQGRLTFIKSHSGLTLAIEYNNQTTSIFSMEEDKKTLISHYEFDEANHLKKTTIPINSDENYAINYAYNEKGLIESISQSDQTKLSFDYEMRNNLPYLKSLSNGKAYTFNYEEEETHILCPLGYKESFTKNTSGLLQKHSHQEQSQEYFYDSKGRVETIQHQDGTCQTFHYDQLGFYSEITGRMGEKRLFSHDLNTGLMLAQTQIVNQTKLNTSYVYNENQALVYKILANGAVHEYCHDDKGNIISERVYLHAFFDLNNNISQSSVKAWCQQQNQAATALSSWTYDSYGNKKSQTKYANIGPDGEGIKDEFMAYEEYEWNPHGELLTAKRKLNDTEVSIKTAKYDGLLRLSEEINAQGQVTTHGYKANQHYQTQPTGLVTTSTWNKAGEVISIQEQASRLSQESILTYDKAGRVCIIEKEGAKEYLIYDEFNRVLYSIDSALRVTQLSYDANNNLKDKYHYKTSLLGIDEQALKNGNFKPEVSGEYSLESSVYDASGRLIFSIDGDNCVTQHCYDSLGNIIKTIDYANPLTKDDRKDLKPKESAKDRIHQFYFNKSNQLAGEQLPSGQIIAYTRDAKGCLLEKTTSIGAMPLLTHWDETIIKTVAHKTEIFKLDAMGQCLQHINAEAIASTQTFDAGGRVVTKSCGGETQGFIWDKMDRAKVEYHSSGLEVSKTYAACGKLESETKIDTLANTAPRTTAFRYDGLNRLSHEIAPRLSLDPNLNEDKALRHHYNQAGLKISSQDELGNTSYFYYNEAQELCFSISPTGSIREYTYESMFHQCASSRFYSLCLSKLELSALSGGSLTPELKALFHSKQNDKDAIESFEYTNRGKLYKKTDAEGFKTINQYDAFGNLSQTRQQIDDQNELVCEMEYDKANRLIKKIQDVGGINATQTWEYVDDEKLVIHTDANGNVSKTYHDNLGRIVKVINAQKGEETLEWDDLSRLKSSSDPLYKTNYAYENQGRKVIKTCGSAILISEKNAFGEVELKQNEEGLQWRKSYDVDGQLKTKIDPDKNRYDYKYNKAGWLVEVIDPQGKATCYEHNQSGQVEKQIEKGQNQSRETSFKRDAQGRELLKTDANGISIQSIYDKRGLKTDKIIDPDNLGLKKHKQYNGLGKVVKKTLGDAQESNQEVTELVRDNLGRLKNTIVDPEDLNLITTSTYDANGNRLSITDPNGYSTRFCYDALNRQRFSIDPLGFVNEKQYDKKGRVVEERQYTRKLNLDAITEFSLEQIEKLVCPSDEDKVSYHTYDKDGNKLSSLENNRLTKTRYNAQGKKTHEIVYATPMTKAEFLADSPTISLKDRHSAWFYDGCGNERFAINGEGLVTEKIWNKKGWLIEKRAYACPYFNYKDFPTPKSHPNDRIKHYLHDDFGRVIFKINGEGYVKEYAYDKGDKPITTWLYPDKIIVPKLITLSTLRGLLPDNKTIPCIKDKYDGAYRKIESIDELNYKEEFKLDAKGELIEHLDKGGDSWTFKRDKAGRKIEEATPPVAIHSVDAEGFLVQSWEPQRVIKKIEYQGNIVKITEGYGSKDARTLELHQNPFSKTTDTIQREVAVFDDSLKPTSILGKRPHYIEDYQGSQPKPNKRDRNGRQEVLQTLYALSAYNAFQKPIVLKNEKNYLSFRVYEADELRYEIDEEGYVTGFEYDVFGNIIKLTRYAKALEVDLKAFAEKGISLSDMAKLLKKSDEDRSVEYEFDRTNRPTKTSEDSIFVYLPKADGLPNYGEYAPVTIKEYNAFNEVHTEKELICPFTNSWKVQRAWFNKAGHTVAKVDELNYLTTYVPNRKGDSLLTTEYAKPLTLALDANTSVETLKQAQVFDKLDRQFINAYDNRGDLVKVNQYDVELGDFELDLSTMLYLSARVGAIQGKQTFEHTFKRNAKGLVFEEILPNGVHLYTKFNARNLPILETKAPRLLETGPATPVVTKGYNAFGQPTIITHHYNPYENEAYLKAHDEDQTHLTGYDNRGLKVVSVDPEGAHQYQSYTKTKQLAAKWIWVSGWASPLDLKKRLHLTCFERDKRGLETKCTQSIEDGKTVVTTSRSNAFGEKIAQGHGDGNYPIYWLYNKVGEVWNTNEQNGVPTISLTDARGLNTATLKSRTRPLQEVKTLSSLKSLMDLDYRELQRLELELDARGDILSQSLPAFSTLKPEDPEPYLTEVTSGDAYPEIGKLSLSWPIPDIAGLEAQVSLWVKGREKEVIKLETKTSKTRSGVDVSQLPLDNYQYQIDFYYRDPQNNKLEGFPRYRSEGSAFINTDLVLPRDNLSWHQIDEQSIMLYGNLGDVSGIELIQEGQAVGRVAITTMDKPHCYLVDLSDKVSGRYEFRLLHGYSLVEEEPVKLGVPSAKGSRIDKVATGFSQKICIYTHLTNFAVISTWDNLPPQINNLYQELTVTNAVSTDNKTNFVKYDTQTKTVDLGSASPGKSESIYSYYPGYFLIKNSTTVSKNRLYTIDADNKQWTVAEIINPLHGLSEPSFVYIQPAQGLLQVDAIRERFAEGQLGKTIALSSWVNHSFRCDASFFNNNASYDLISLKTSISDSTLGGEITIHTANTNSKQLLVREIALTKTMVSKIKPNIPINWSRYLVRQALNFKWSLPHFLSTSPMKANFQVHFNQPGFKRDYGEYYNFEYVVGRGHTTSYNGHLCPDSRNPNTGFSFSDFDLSHLSLHVKYGKDWVPLLNSNTFKTDNTVRTKPFYMEVKVVYSEKPDYYTPSTSEYQEADVSTFQDSYTLLFYPLPEGLDETSIQLDYLDNSLRSPQWRNLANFKYTGHAIAAPANAIPPGNYQYRLKAKNLQGQYIDFSQMAEFSKEGWAMGNFEVRHGGAICKTQPQLEVIRPTRKQSLDRWRNVVSSTNLMQDKTEFSYNGRNKLLKTTEPLIEITEENGQTKTIAPTTRQFFDKGDNIIGVLDANNHLLTHERDNDGKTLKTTDADKVFKQFIPDIFGRTKKVCDYYNKETIHVYNRRNHEILRKDACGWPTHFDENELGDRIRIINGNNEALRYDYKHPARLPTKIYRPDNECTLKDYEDHGVLIKEELPDKRTNTWGVDDFGNVNSHTDLGGAIYTHSLNPCYPTEIQEIKSQGGKLRERLTIDGKTSSMSNQDIAYLRDEASNLISILDNAQPLTTHYRYDRAMRRARETFIGSDGHIHQAVLMNWNALNWVSEVLDSMMKVKFSHDAVGNRRSTIAYTFWNNKWCTIGYAKWHTYTAANRMAINCGVLKEDGTIRITPEQGTMLLYDGGGRREHEITMKANGSMLDKTLTYMDNNLLKRTILDFGHFCLAA